MPIEDRNLKPGTVLVARHKGQDYKCKVVETKDGLRFQMVDSRGEAVSVKSPSAIGSYVMGGNACNGWRFWSVEGQEPVPKTRGRKAKGGKAKEASKNGGNPATFENVADPEEADGRFWCNCCADGFSAPAGVEPIGCPKGHSAAESAGCDGSSA